MNLNSTRNERWTSLDLSLDNGDSSHTLRRPYRRPSNEQCLNGNIHSSTSSLSICSSFDSSFDSSIVQQRCTNMEDIIITINSFGSSINHSNNIWRSTSSPIKNKNKNKSKNNISNKRAASLPYHQSSKISSIANGNHHQRRWSANAENESASDQPIGMIKRNHSSESFPTSP
jgi:hypothetical protein